MLPIDSYLALRADWVAPGRPFGYQRQYTEQGCNADTKGSWEGAIRKSNEVIYQCFNHAVEDWAKDNMLLTEMLKLKEKHFLKVKNRLVVYVEVRVRILKNEAKKVGHFKIRKRAVDDTVDSGTHTVADPKLKERTFEEDVAQLIANAPSKGHTVYDLRNLSL